jgi:hypothetical protein
MPLSWPKMRVPKWSNGFLVAVQGDNTANPLIWLINRNGQQTVPFTIPGARTMLLYDWDRGADGTIGMSGYAADSDGRFSAFIAFISPNEWESHVIRTLGYRPAKVAVAADGTLWASGCEYVISANGRPTSALIPGAGVIRHFDRSGKLLGAYIPQSTVGGPLILSSWQSGLRASRDRVAWLSVDGRFVEITLDGKVTTDMAVPVPGGESTEITGFALTDGGDAFISVVRPIDEDRNTPGEIVAVYVLDRSSNNWKPVLERTVSARNSLPVDDDYGHIYGVEENTLVLSGKRLIKFYRIGK